MNTEIRVVYYLLPSIVILMVFYSHVGVSKEESISIKQRNLRKFFIEILNNSIHGKINSHRQKYKFYGNFMIKNKYLFSIKIFSSLFFSIKVLMKLTE